MAGENYPLTRRTDRAQLARFLRTPEGVLAVENLQRDVLELFRRLAEAEARVAALEAAP